MFINFSNHDSSNWSETQIYAAMQWGNITDVRFPNVPAEATEEDIQRLSCQCVNQICAFQPEAVMCQGEFTLAFAVVTMLKKKGITVVSACSERKAVESFLEDGSCKKSSIFEFVKFRKY